MNIEKKARLRIEISTRFWSSSFLMIQSFHKAIIRKAFSVETPCPVSLEEIEIYLQILLPAYQFSLIMQKDSSSIDDVLPALTIMISKWW